MSHFRPQPQRGFDRGGGHNFRPENIKAPPAIGSGGGRHYFNERRSPIPLGRDLVSREPPAQPRHQSPPRSGPGVARHENSHRAGAAAIATSSRHKDFPQVGSSRYQDQQPSSREAPAIPTSRHSDSTKRAPTSSSRRSPSPRSSSRKQTISATAKSSSKSKTSHVSHSHAQSSSAGVGHSSKSSRPSTSDSQLISAALLLSNNEKVIREILNANDVKIPRRNGEGARPIFDRDELRESIQKRIKSGDHEQNPAEQIEQRVVAIIREPVIIDPFAASASSSNKHSSQAETRHRHPSPDVRRTTASGLSYSMNATSPPRQYAARRSPSPVRPPVGREPPHLDSDRRRDRDRDREHMHAVAPNFGGERSRDNFIPSRRERSRSRSRSPIDRVRRIALNPPPGSGLGSFGNRFGGERDLRESLSRGPKQEPPVSREVVEARSGMRGRGFVRGGFSRRPRGSFGPRGRGFGRREPQWQHDKFDRDGGDSANQL